MKLDYHQIEKRSLPMRYITERSMCSRRFESENGEDLWAYFWAPYQRDNGDFICDYLVVGRDAPIASCNIGVDGLDAILGATDQVRIIVRNAAGAGGGKLSWWGFDADFRLYNSESTQTSVSGDRVAN